MCGIIGLYGNSTHIQTTDKRKFMLEGLYIDALRGQESTGIAMLPLHAKKNPEIYKRALSGGDFIEKKPTLRLLGNLTSSTGVIGHNRSSTRGIIHDENSHPFQYKHITLVHNGTVTNADGLLKRKCEADSDVDSAKVAWAFSEAEPDDLLPELSGGYSLVWWDARDATLHFARNTEKPMCWLVSDDAQMMYFASELGMLRMLVDRNGLKVKKTAFFTGPYKHYIFKTANNVEKYDVRPFQNPAQKSGKRGKNLPALTSNPTTSSIQRGGPLPNQSHNSPPTNSTSTTPTSSSTSDTASGGSLNRPGPFFYNNKLEYVHPAETEVLTKDLVKIIMSGVNDKQRVAHTRTMADREGFEPFKTITAKPVYWKTYKDEKQMGVMFLRLDDANIQVFNVNLHMWAKCASMQHAPIQIVSYRLSFDDSTGVAPVFVGELNLDLFGKMYDSWKVAVSPPRRERVAGETLYEVGFLRPRWVTFEEFNELVECGCYNCMHPILHTESENVTWFGPEENWPLCPECSKDERIVAEWRKIAQDSDESFKNTPVTH